MRLLYYSTDYIVGHYVKIAPHVRWKQSLVLYERYYYDFIVDPRRARINLPSWVAKSILPLIPQPDIVIYLDAPPEVLYARKPELPIEEFKRLVKEYNELMLELPNAYTIDATKPVDDILLEICKQVLDQMGE